MLRRALVLVFAILAVACASYGCSGSGAGADLGGDGGPSGGSSGTSGSSGSSGSSGVPGADGGPGGCKPLTCARAGVDCGQAPDGCGGTITCGSCPTDQTCGGGGTANVCGHGVCTPKTCASEKKNCGVVSDGCASTLSCGTCAPGQTCGAGGPNVCGTGSCTPTTCAAQGKDCGSISDGCGGQLACGICPSGKLCGSGGAANVCAEACPAGCPTGYSCDATGVCVGGNANGLVFDVKTFAVGGTVTVNGAAPVASSSSGFATVTFTEPTLGYTIAARADCNASAGNPCALAWSAAVYPGTYRVTVHGTYLTPLPGAAFVVNPALVVNAPNPSMAFDVKTLAVGGTVTVNGAAPVASSSSGFATITFTEPTLGYTITARADCNASAGAPCPLTFSGTIYPGIYRATVNGTYLSAIPGARYVAVERIKMP